MRPGPVVLSALALTLAAALAGAAPRRAASAKASAQGPRADMFGGYSYTHAGEASLHGWGLSGSYALRDALSLVADISGHYGSYAGADLGQLDSLGDQWAARALVHLRFLRGEGALDTDPRFAVGVVCRLGR